MPKKRGPKTERLDGELTPSTVLLDEKCRRMAAAVHPGSLSRAVREGLRLLYERYQRSPD